jgi:hypothetical protein
MSGGYFDYIQFRFDDVLEQIQGLIDNNNVTTDDRNARNYSPETIEKFEFAFNALNNAKIYLHRIDWLVSNDDSEESFHKRLQEDFSK